MIDFSEGIKLLCRKYSAYGGRVQHDIVAKSESFATLTMPNGENPKFPLTVMLYESGYALVGLGSSDAMLRCDSEGELCGVIDDVLSDKVYFTSHFRSEKDFDVCRVYGGRVDTDANKYKEYIASLEGKVGFFEKLFGDSSGIYETTDFSGRSYRVIKRGIKERS